MSTYVFLNIPARGHINPTLPIIRELTAHGASVKCFLPEEFRRDIETVGGSIHAPPQETRFRGAGSGAEQAPGDDRIALLPFAMARASTLIVPPLIESIQALRPDCLVYNTLNLWACLAAHALRTPAVGFRPFHAPREHRSVVAPFATEKLARLASAADENLDELANILGHPPLTLQQLVSRVEDLTIIFMPKEFQSGAEAFDDRFLFVGPSLRDAGPGQWPFAKPAGGDRLRLYISLGTLRNDEPEFYRKCMRAFEQSEWEVVMSVGNKIDIGSLGPLPGNFVVEPTVPQIELLQSVDVFVSHGGLNSTMESLNFGVPLVVIPTIREQRLTARRVQELGLGIVLDHEALTPEILRESARTAARDLDIRARVKTMQQHMRTAGGSFRATEAIIRFTDGTTASPRARVVERLDSPEQKGPGVP